MPTSYQQQAYNERRDLGRLQLLESAQSKASVEAPISRLAKAASRGDFKQEVQKKLSEVTFLKSYGKRGTGGFAQTIQRGGGRQRGTITPALGPKKGGSSLGEHGMKVTQTQKRWSTQGYKDTGRGLSIADSYFNPGTQAAKKYTSAGAGWGMATGGEIGTMGALARKAGDRRTLSRLTEQSTKSRAAAVKSQETRRKADFQARAKTGKAAVKEVDKYIQKRLEYDSFGIGSLFNLVTGGPFNPYTQWAKTLDTLGQEQNNG